MEKKYALELTKSNFRNWKLFSVLMFCLVNLLICKAQCTKYQVYESITSNGTLTSGGTWLTSGVNFNTNGGRTGNNYLAFGGKNQYVSTPLIADPAIFSFWYRTNGTINGNNPWGQYTVQTSSDNLNWIDRASTGIFTTNVYTYFSIDLGVLGLTNVYVRILDTRAKGTAARYVDDISWTSTVNVNNTAIPAISNCTQFVDFGTSYNFTDDGGTSDTYNNNEDRTVTFSPSLSTDKVVLNFTNFNTENKYDGMVIYDGPDTSYPIISSGLPTGSNATNCPSGSFYGTTSPGLVTSSDASGAITIRFRSDGNTVNNGWSATVSISARCAGTPTGGTTILTPSSGAPSSSFIGSATGGTAPGSGLTYQWQIGDAATGPWTDISGATSANANLTAVPLPGTIKYYRRKIKCTNFSVEAFSSAVPFTTTTPAICRPTVDHPNNLYINSVEIAGTMVVPPINNSLAGTNGTGYSDYTTLTPLAEQAQGEGVNVIATSTGTTFLRGTWKAWVDWNGNGSFSDPGEEVYNIYGYVGTVANFGFVVPSTQTPGNYRMRIRVNNGITYNGSESYGFDFSPCDPFKDGSGFFADKDGYGETEDYFIKVVANCPNKILTKTDGVRCGTGTVALAATATADVTNFKWYDAPTGGNLIGTTNATGVSTTWTTPSISATTLYYVAAVGAGCESTFRVAVKAEIKQTPVITFTPSTAEFCGDSSVIEIAATGSKEIVNLIKEDFEGGGLGVFQNVHLDANTGATNTQSKFQNETSVYIPAANVWFPALSSGFGGNKFVIATSDTKASHSNPIENALTLTNSVNTQGLDNLTLKFRIYYSRYFADGNNPATNQEYTAVEVSTNNGATYTNQILKLIVDQGNAGSFETITYDLSAFVGNPNLKIRIRHYSWADATGFLPDGVAIDDVELFGEKPLQPSFTYLSANPIGIFEDAAGTVTYAGGAIDKVYFKPTTAQIEQYANWNITATANLTNGCNASGVINITNNSKIWNTASTDWNAASWKPATAIPDATKCVIIKTPVILGTTTNGLAKNIVVKAGGGDLKIAGNLTVTDFVKNEGTADNLTVNSDGNLIQINSSAPNSGSINAERDVTDMDNVLATQMDYVYWSSPVSGQITKGTAAGAFSPGTTSNRFYSYRESNDRFYETADLTFTPGRGYAVQAETAAGFPPNPVGYSKTYHFRGTPNNGDISYDIIRSADAGSMQHGYNMVGNPYPSNISFDQLYAANSALIFNTLYLWTNTTYTTQQQGSGYGGNNYAVYNGSGGNPPAGPGYQTKPDGIIKVGQGFIIQKRSVGGPASLQFKNSYGIGQDLRVTTAGGSFYQKNTGLKNRFWLTLKSPDDLVNTLLIAYVSGASNSFEPDFDTEILGMSSDVFFSKSDDKQLLVQGRDENFVTTDHVQLGANFFSAGTYTIALDTAEGIFNGSQKIYLKDKVTGAFIDLSIGSYTFQATAGLSDGRFEIVYEPEITLGTGNVAKENLQVYRDAGEFVIKAPQKISEVDLFDPSGRLILKVNPNSVESRINGNQLISGVFILRIKLLSGEIVTRKIRK